MEAHFHDAMRKIMDVLAAMDRDGLALLVSGEPGKARGAR